ncbi:hypothetical protein ACRALDRAFT_211093 [Sodiomyces alcalophilus JCM 7366]|uniref:uncharacterized protein n=1 Tax=Sodiomyces alcalophilus JCM 7366 TaxID=591952 RepID=UPI0039B6CE98
MSPAPDAAVTGAVESVNVPGQPPIGEPDITGPDEHSTAPECSDVPSIYIVIDAQDATNSTSSIHPLRPNCLHLHLTSSIAASFLLCHTLQIPSKFARGSRTSSLHCVFPRTQRNAVTALPTCRYVGGKHNSEGEMAEWRVKVKSHSLACDGSIRNRLQLISSFAFSSSFSSHFHLQILRTPIQSSSPEYRRFLKYRTSRSTRPLTFIYFQIASLFVIVLNTPATPIKTSTMSEEAPVDQEKVHVVKRWIGKTRHVGNQIMEKLKPGHYRGRVEQVRHMCRKGKVLEALDAYREAILDANYRRVCREAETTDGKYIDHVIAEEAPEKAEMGLNHRGDRVMENGSLLPLGFSKPAHFTANWHEILESVHLDGTRIYRNWAARVVWRKRYLAGIREGLVLHGAGDVRFPLEFEYIMREVDTLDGPGMPLDRERRYTIQFWEGLGWTTAVHLARDRVRDGRTIRLLANLPHTWQVKVGWKSGEGPKMQTSCWITYCACSGTFLGDDLLGRKRYAGRKGWAWRYMVVDEQLQTYDMFDDVCQLLEWYVRDSRLPHIPEEARVPAQS